MTTPSRYCHTCWNMHPWCVCSKPANPASWRWLVDRRVLRVRHQEDAIRDAIIDGIIDPFHRLPPHPRGTYYFGNPANHIVYDLDDYDPVLEATRALYLDEGTT